MHCYPFFVFFHFSVFYFQFFSLRYNFCLLGCVGLYLSLSLSFLVGLGNVNFVLNRDN